MGPHLETSKMRIRISFMRKQKIISSTYPTTTSLNSVRHHRFDIFHRLTQDTMHAISEYHAGTQAWAPEGLDSRSRSPRSQSMFHTRIYSRPCGALVEWWTVRTQICCYVLALLCFRVYGVCPLVIFYNNTVEAVKPWSLLQSTANVPGTKM